MGMFDDMLDDNVRRGLKWNPTPSILERKAGVMDLVVTLGGKPLADQAQGVRAFKRLSRKPSFAIVSRLNHNRPAFHIIDRPVRGTDGKLHGKQTGHSHPSIDAAMRWLEGFRT